MKYTITKEQVEAVLQTVYQTNISAAQFDVMKKFFSELPKVEKEEVKPE